jgi:hypothetical protein
MRLGGPAKIIENNCLQDSNIVRKSCQIEGATPETKTKNQNKKMKTETTEPTIDTYTLEELRAMHEARLDYCDAQDCCWEDSAE